MFQDCQDRLPLPFWCKSYRKIGCCVAIVIVLKLKHILELFLKSYLEIFQPFQIAEISVSIFFELMDEYHTFNLHSILDQKWEMIFTIKMFLATLAILFHWCDSQAVLGSITQIQLFEELLECQHSLRTAPLLETRNMSLRKSNLSKPT